MMRNEGKPAPKREGAKKTLEIKKEKKVQLFDLPLIALN